MTTTTPSETPMCCLCELVDGVRARQSTPDGAALMGFALGAGMVTAKLETPLCPAHRVLLVAAALELGHTLKLEQLAEGSAP